MGTHEANCIAWVPGRSRRRNHEVLRHPQTRVPLRKSQPKVLGGWESPWPCTDLPSPGSSLGTSNGWGGDGRAAPTVAFLGSPVLSPRGVGFARQWRFGVPTVLLGCWGWGQRAVLCILPVPLAVCSGSTGFVPIPQCGAGSVPSPGLGGLAVRWGPG